VFIYLVVKVLHIAGAI